MKESLILVLFLMISFRISIDPSKVLIIYFSRTGNTELFSNYIKEKTNMTTYKIVPVTPYPDDYNTMLNLAKEERKNGVRPAIKDPLKDISKYDIILLGYPIWNGYEPNIVINQLEQLDLKGKIIFPFNTHGSSGVGSSIGDIKAYAMDATVKDGFPISQSNIKNKEESMNQITEWLEKNFQFTKGETKSEEPNENSTETDTFDVISQRNNNKIIKINYLIYLILLIFIP